MNNYKLQNVLILIVVGIGLFFLWFGLIVPNNVGSYLAGQVKEYCGGAATASFNEDALILSQEFQTRIIELNITDPVAPLDFAAGPLAILAECENLKALQVQLGAPDANKNRIWGEVSVSRKRINALSPQMIFDTAMSAIETYAEAKALDQSASDEHLMLARLYLADGKWQEALAASQAALYAAKAAMSTATVEVTTEFFMVTPDAWPTETPMAFPTIAPP